MKKRLLLTALIVAALFAALRLAGDLPYWKRYLSAAGGQPAQDAARLVAPRIVVAGAAQEPVRASAEAELLAPEALEAARVEALRRGVRALLVHRHGHRLLEYFMPGASEVDEVAGGELSPVPFALAIGVLADARRVDLEDAIQVVQSAAAAGAPGGNPWSRTARQRFSLGEPPAMLLQDAESTIAETLSSRVWQPLRAGDAWLWGVDDSALRVDCCMVARLADWMRVGDVLLGQGNLHGERIVSPDWIRRILIAGPDERREAVWLATPRTWTGDEPPAARDMIWFDLGSDLRLWLVPRRGLAVMVWAAGADAPDTTLPNIIVRGLLDQAPPVGGTDRLDELVPGH
jgi:hypothetical protein